MPASVTTNDGMPKPVKSAPWTAPIAIPQTTPMAIARYGSQPCFTFSTATTAAPKPLATLEVIDAARRSAAELRP